VVITIRKQDQGFVLEIKEETHTFESLDDLIEYLDSQFLNIILNEFTERTVL